MDIFSSLHYMSIIRDCLILEHFFFLKKSILCNDELNHHNAVVSLIKYSWASIFVVIGENDSFKKTYFCSL